VALAVGLYKAVGEDGFSKMFEIASGTDRHVNLANA
jgi:hypothetical protein